jgi:probable phosphoglycerate mutase
MSEKTIYFIRHGETDYNRMRIVQGSGVDTSLNDTGRSQADAFYQCYAHVPFEAVLTSKLKRTHETVAPFLVQKQLPWEQFGEINEMNWGRHEGQPYDPAMSRYFEEVMKAWSAGEYHVPFADGESAWTLAERMRPFIGHLRERTEKTLLVCSHGRALRCLLCLLLDLPLSEMRRFSHANTGLYLLRYSGERFELDLQNDTRHLDAVLELPGTSGAL